MPPSNIKQQTLQLMPTTWVSVEEGNVESKKVVEILSWYKNREEQEYNPLDTLLHHD